MLLEIYVERYIPLPDKKKIVPGKCLLSSC